MIRTRFAPFAAALVGAACAGRLPAQDFSPEEAVRRMQVPDNLEVKLVACEPDMTNDFGDPERVSARPSTFGADGPRFADRFPPLSLTVIRWTVGGG